VSPISYLQTCHSSPSVPAGPVNINSVDIGTDNISSDNTTTDFTSTDIAGAVNSTASTTRQWDKLAPRNNFLSQAARLLANRTRRVPRKKQWVLETRV
jgi:hypothetical protein